MPYKPLRRRHRKPRLESLEQRNMFNGGSISPEYVLPDQFYARNYLAPSQHSFYLDAETVPRYEDLQDDSRFELVAGVSHDLDGSGVEVGLYLGGSRQDIQRQAFLGVKHIDKETDLESFTVHDYGSIVPATLKVAQEQATPLSPEYVESEWSTGSNIIAAYGFWKDAMLYEIEKRPDLFDSAGWQKELKWASRAAQAFKGIGTALDLWSWHEGQERAIVYGADRAIPKCQYGLTTGVTWGTIGEPIVFNAKHDWNALHREEYPEFVARDLKIIFERQEVIVTSDQGVKYLFTRYKITEAMQLEATDTEEVAGWHRSTWAIVDHRPLFPDSRFPESFVMEESVYMHHEQVDASMLAVSYRASESGGTYDIRKTLIHVIDAIRRQDYDPNEGRFFNTHTIASIADAVYLDRSRVWAAWDQPRMPMEFAFAQIGIEGQSFKQPPEPPALDEGSCYVVGEPRQDTPPPPPLDTTPPPRPNIFINSPTTVYKPTIIVSGYTEPGALVRVVEHQHGTNEDFENAVPFSSGEADEHGRFNIHLPLVADAANVFSFAAEDGAGNISDSVKTPPIFYRESPEGLRELLPHAISELGFSGVDLQQALKKYDLAKTTYFHPRTWPHGAPVQYETDQHWHYSKPAVSYYSVTDRETDATSHILELTLEHSSYDRGAERQIAAFDSSVLINIGEFPTNDGKLTLDSRLLDFHVLTQLATPEDAAFEAIVDSGEAWKLLEDFVSEYVGLLNESGITPVWISEPIDRSRIGEGPGVEAIVDRKDYRTGASNPTRLLGASDRIVLIGHDGGRIEAYDTKTERSEELSPPNADFDPKNVFTTQLLLGKQLLSVNTNFNFIGDNFLPVNEKLVFLARSLADEIDPDLGRGRNLGTALWSTDGTLEGTRILANLTTLDDEGEPVREAPCFASGIRSPFYSNYYCGDSGLAQTEPTNFTKGAEGLYFIQLRDMEHTLRDGIRWSGGIEAGKRFDVYFTDGDSVTKVMSHDFDGGRFYFRRMVSNEQGSVFLVAQQSSGGRLSESPVTFQLTPEGAHPIYEGSMLWAVGDVAYYSVPSRPPKSHLINLRTGEPVALPFTKYAASHRGDVVEVTSFDVETWQEKVFLNGDGSFVDLPEVPNSSALKIAVVDGEYYLSARPLQKLTDGEWKIVSEQGPSQRHGSLLYNPYQVFTPNRIALPKDSTFHHQQLFESDSYLYFETGGTVYRIDAGLADVERNRIDVPEVQIDFLPPADDTYVHSHEDIPITIEARYGEDGVTATKFSLDLPDDLIQSSLSGELDSYYASQGDFIIARHFPGRAGELFVEFWRVDFENSVLKYLPTPEPYAPFRGVYDRIREDGFYVWYREQDQYWKLEGDQFVVVESIPEASTESVPPYLGFDVPQDTLNQMRNLGGDSTTSLAQRYTGSLAFLLFEQSETQQSPAVQITSVRSSTEKQDSIVVTGTAAPGTMLVSPPVGQTPNDVFFNGGVRQGSPRVATADDEGRFEITIRVPDEFGVHSGNLLAYGTNGYVTQIGAEVWPTLLGEPSASEAFFDVNDDGRVSSLDALLIINFLNANQDTPMTPGSHAYPSNVSDISGDGVVSSLDALMIINYLNGHHSVAAGEQIRSPEFVPAIIHHHGDRVPFRLSRHQQYDNQQEIWPIADHDGFVGQTIDLPGSEDWLDVIALDVARSDQLRG